MEQSLSDVQHRLSVKTNELQAAHHQIDKLEEKIGVCLYRTAFLCTLPIYSSARLHLIGCSLSCCLFSLMHLSL